MLKNLLLNSIFPILFLSTNSFAQKITVSKVLPESEGVIIGTWNSKIISQRGAELCIVDTALVNPVKRVVEIEPQVEKLKIFQAIHHFIHDRFLFEVYVAYEKKPFRRYNLIVKRDLETMEMVSYKKLDHFYSHVKFVKHCKSGFYICLGNSYPYVDFSGAYTNYAYPLTADKIVPTQLYGMDYDLSKSWTMEFQDLRKRHDLYMNDITFDEDYLLIPEFFREILSENERDNGKGVNLTIADTEGKLATFRLNIVDLDNAFRIHSVKLKYDEEAQKISGLLLVERRNNVNLPMDGYYDCGYVYAEWNEKGEMTESKLNIVSNGGIFGSYLENPDNSKKALFNPNGSNPLREKADVLFFEILENGDALYIVNNVCKKSYDDLMNSKFILRISKEGKIKWFKLIPYGANRLYEQTFCSVRNGKIHLLTREFSENFSTGSYIYNDTKQIVSGESVLMADRVMDLETGEVISHKPILSFPMGKFEPAAKIYQNENDQFIIRYRDSRANLEKLVIMKF